MLINLLEGATNNSSFLMIGLIVVMFAGLFLISSFSQKKKQKQMQEMINKLKVGDSIKTIGGIIGEIVEVIEFENAFVITTGNDENRSYMKFDKNAVYNYTAPIPYEETPEEVALEVKEVESTEEIK